MTEPTSSGTEFAAAIDVCFMDHALALATRGVALASPNPMVGAVLVRDGKIVGEGFYGILAPAGTSPEIVKRLHDAIVKVPWNDPLTMSAIARTMIEMAPDHPLTKHLTVCYWQSGDDAVEARFYQPAHIEKIVAWGGRASLKHIGKYLQPGIDLIALDPKSSTTLIGKEALTDEDTMRSVARRTAADLGGWDQEACVNARVMFLESGTDADGIALIPADGLADRSPAPAGRPAELPRPPDAGVDEVLRDGVHPQHRHRGELGVHARSVQVGVCLP